MLLEVHTLPWRQADNPKSEHAETRTVNQHFRRNAKIVGYLLKLGHRINKTVTYQ